MTTDTPPLVTIGISTFNRVAGTFPAALESALDQTYPALEVLVCDNASEDGTEDFMRRRADPRLRYHRHPTNIGANANFNSCLELARGRYFLLLHDDDLLKPTFVERAMAALADRDPGVLLAAAEVIDQNGRVRYSPPPPPPDLDAAGLLLAWFTRRTSFYLCSTIFHAERLREAGGFESPHGLLQDVVAISRLAARHGYVSVPMTGGSFRRHDSNRGSASHALHWADDSVHLLQTLRSELPRTRSGEVLEAGGPYLTNKCYRYVWALPSPLERWRLYREVYRRLGHTYAPWRYVVKRWRGVVRGAVGPLVRSWTRRCNADTAR